jgi:hypothetical protein
LTKRSRNACTLDDPDGFYIQDEPGATPALTAIQADDDYGDMNLPETPDADDVDDALADKYLNAELIFDVGTGNERRGRVVKRARGTSVSLSVGLMPIPYSTRVRT